MSIATPMGFFIARLLNAASKISVETSYGNTGKESITMTLTGAVSGQFSDANKYSLNVLIPNSAAKHGFITVKRPIHAIRK